MVLHPPPTGLPYPPEGPGSKPCVNLLRLTQGPYSGQNQLQKQCLLFLPTSVNAKAHFRVMRGSINV